MSRLSSPYLAAVLAIGSAAILPAAAHADNYSYYGNDGAYVIHNDRGESCRDRRDGNTAGGAVTGAIVGGAAAAVPGAVVGAVIGGSIGNSATHCGYYRDRYAYDDRNGYDYNYDNDRRYRDHYRRDDYGYRSDGYYGYDRRDPYYGDRRHNDRDGW